MKTLLLAVAGAVVASVAILALVWLWLRRRVVRPLGTVDTVSGGGGDVLPPFRITLEPGGGDPSLEWSDAGTVAATGDALAALGYVSSGDYRVPQMPGVMVRGFVHPRAMTLAAFYQHPVTGLVLDIARAHADRTHVTVTTAPDERLDRPAQHAKSHVDLDLTDHHALGHGLRGMHRAVMAESAERAPVAVTPRLFATAFVAAYAREMDWRIARGGVSAEEIRRTALAGGQPEPGPEAIDVVQAMWRGAIEQFVAEEVERACLERGVVSRNQWRSMRARTRVVHEHSSRETLAGELAEAALAVSRAGGGDDAIRSDSAVEALVADLLSAMGAEPLPAGFERALARLPEPARYQTLGAVDKPWRGTLYLLPGTTGLEA